MYCEQECKVIRAGHPTTRRAASSHTHYVTCSGLSHRLDQESGFAHDSRRNTSSASVHHPGPLSLPVAPGTKLFCIPSVSWRSQHRITGPGCREMRETYLPPFPSFRIVLDRAHLCLELIWWPYVAHVCDEQVVRLKVVDRIVCTVSSEDSHRSRHSHRRSELCAGWLGLRARQQRAPSG